MNSCHLLNPIVEAFNNLSAEKHLAWKCESLYINLEAMSCQTFTLQYSFCRIYKVLHGVLVTKVTVLKQNIFLYLRNTMKKWYIKIKKCCACKYRLFCVLWYIIVIDFIKENFLVLSCTLWRWKRIKTKASATQKTQPTVGVLITLYAFITPFSLLEIEIEIVVPVFVCQLVHY